MTKAPWKSKNLITRLRWWGFKFCGKGDYENIASDVMCDAADRIEKLEEEIGVLFAANVRLNSRADLDGDHHRDRIEQLAAALHNVITAWDFWQKTKDSNSFTELFVRICEAKEMEGIQ